MRPFDYRHIDNNVFVCIVMLSSDHRECTVMWSFDHKGHIVMWSSDHRDYTL